MHAGLGADLGERMRDVVAVADVDELDAGEPADVLADGQRVGHALARVVRVGEPVDHRDLTIPGEVLHVRLGEGADHDAVHVAAHHVGGVPDGLADAQLDVARIEEHRLGAELLDADLEAHARARRGLHEDHRDGAAGEHGVRLARLLRGLELGRKVEQGGDFRRREVVDGEEAAAGEVELGEPVLEGLGHGTSSRRLLTAAVWRRGGDTAGTGRSTRAVPAVVTP